MPSRLVEEIHAGAGASCVAGLVHDSKGSLVCTRVCRIESTRARRCLRVRRLHRVSIFRRVGF